MVQISGRKGYEQWLCMLQEMGIKRWGCGGEVEDGCDRHEQ